VRGAERKNRLGDVAKEQLDLMRTAGLSAGIARMIRVIASTPLRCANGDDLLGRRIGPSTHARRRSLKARRETLASAAALTLATSLLFQ